MRKPIIGITGPDSGGGSSRWAIGLGVRLAGGKAVWITPKNPREIDRLDGLIISGGADVNPELYGAERIRFPPPPKLADESIKRYLLNLVIVPLTWLSRKWAEQYVCSEMDIARDELEFKMVKLAIEKGIPCLGICRGEQLLNVFFGGTLHQGLESFYVEGPEIQSYFPRKKITVVEGTLLFKIMKSTSRRVNGLHLQGVATVANDMVASAFDRNGIVQAIEHKTLPFILGVQWHPEYLLHLPAQRGLFISLVREAKRSRREALEVISDQKKKSLETLHS